jgi:pilus assembly protein Flp/PilA
MNTLQRFVNDESGASSIEYIMIAALVSIVFVVAAEAIGLKLNSTFTQVENAFPN